MLGYYTPCNSYRFNIIFVNWESYAAGCACLVASIHLALVCGIRGSWVSSLDPVDNDDLINSERAG